MKVPRKWLKASLLLIILLLTLFITWQVVGYYQQWQAGQERQRRLKVRRQQEKVAGRRQTLGLVQPQTTWGKQVDQQLQKAGYSGSALVIDHDKPVLHKGYGWANQDKQIKNQPDSVYPLASITKNLTAVMVMRALKQHHLSVDTKLARFYPKLAGSQTVTIKDLLTMMSGYQDVPFPKQMLSEKEFYRYVAQHTKYQGKPEKWHYKAVNYQLLAGVLYQLTGHSYTRNREATFGQYRLIGADSYFKNDRHAIGYRNGHKLDVDSKYFRQEVATGNLMSSDWTAYQLVRDELTGQLLTPSEFKTMTEPYPNESYSGGLYSQAKPAPYYLHGIMLGFESSIYIDQTGQRAVVLLSNHFNSKGRQNSDLAKQIYQTMLTNSHQSSFS